MRKELKCGVRSAECGIERKDLGFSKEVCARIQLSGIDSSNVSILRTPHSALRTSSGFTYIALLAAIVIIGIMMGAATKYWHNVTIRDKEEELLFRGEQYRLAIERYFYAIPGRNQYPQSIDDLLKDSRTAGGKRYLRRKYKDPITGDDFVELRDQLSRRIVGVQSSSDKEPLKQANFPATSPIYADFEGKNKYSEWQFKFLPQGSPNIARPFGQGNPAGQPVVAPIVTAPVSTDHW